MKYIIINSIEKLKKCLDEGKTDFFILYNIGCRSSKYITYADEPGKFEVLNLIDDTTQILSEEDLFDKTKTNIGYAMKNGAFWCENI